MSAPNAELAYLVLDHIDAHPDQWDQATWECGTVACFAGWTVKLSGGSLEDLTDRVGILTPLVIEGPAEIVGLEVDVAAELLLGYDSRAFDEDLFDGLNTRADLDRIAEAIFGPRPAVTP